MEDRALLAIAREEFHEELQSSQVLGVTTRTLRVGTPFENSVSTATNCDASNPASRMIALHMADLMNVRPIERSLTPQTAGQLFETAVASLLRNSFPFMQSLRPGNWEVLTVGGRRDEVLGQYEPYSHLDDIAVAIRSNSKLATALGNAYQVSPDVIVLRHPASDEEINAQDLVVDDTVARHSTMRAANQSRNIVHAIVSCKWTMRSDRAQNSRSEAINALRNRKGRAPHIAVVTAEPRPSILSSLAIGTGDIDMCYHIALPELYEAVRVTQPAMIDELDLLIEGDRLRDISDLPLDLTV